MEIRIWLGDLGAYNAGELRGEWLTLPMDPDELAAKIGRYSENGRGDYFIADHECEVPGLVSESSNPAQLNEWAERLAGLSDHDIKRFTYLYGERRDVDHALDHFEDVQFYEGRSLRQVAEELVDDGCFGPIPTALSHYIDYAAIGRDLRHDGYDETPEGVFHYCG